MSMSIKTRDVSRSTGPVPSAPRINFSTRVVAVCRRGKVKVIRLLRNTFPRNTPPPARAIGESTYRFPYEIMEMVIAHLARDFGTLKACSLTCRSWYIVAVAHLHHTLILEKNISGAARSKLKPLSELHRLRLMPLVKEIRVKQWSGKGDWFVPRAFCRRDLRYFSAFVNVQTLVLQGLQLDRFTPGIERYFGHFSPSLRSITLSRPQCTPRQLSHFLSLFRNLDDIEVRYSGTLIPETIIPHGELVLFSAPKLRGRLTLHFFRWVETWTHLITSYGRPRFRHLDLRGSANCAPLLLGACAKTVETLRFNAMDGSIGTHPPSLPIFNLSQLGALQSLQIAVWTMGYGPPRTHRHTAVMGVFSTITSPVFSELVIVIGGHVVTFLPRDAALFETLRKMNEIRPFKLVFLPDAPEYRQEKVRRELAEALDSVAAEGLLDFLDSPPTVR